MNRSVSLKCFTALLFASMAFAQQDRGTLVGTVTDPSGAAMPGVAIAATHIQTNQRYDSVSNEVGQYRIPKPAHWRLPSLV